MMMFIDALQDYHASIKFYKHHLQFDRNLLDE